MVRIMSFAPGDHVHVAALGKGVVRELRNGGRYLVEVKGRSLVVTVTQLTHVDPAAAPHASRAAPPRTEVPDVERRPALRAPSLDLHGRTVDDSLDALASFLNETLLAGQAEARIIHGRSGGRIKAAVHARLKAMPSIRGFRLDPRNPGVTIVSL